MTLSYLDRVIRFQKLIRQEKIKSSVRTVYMSFLDIFNEYGWKKQIRITYPEIQFVANLSLNSIKRAMIELRELGLMDYRSKQGSKYIYIHIDGLIPDDISYDDLVKERTKLNKKYSKSGEPDDNQSSSTVSDTPAPAAPERSPKGGVTRRQPPAPPNEPYSPDGDHPPDDGVPRNWERLKERLNGLNIPPGDYRKIVQLSDYGRKEHPVWKALNELDSRKGTKDAVKSPGAWIQWYINQNPPKATAPAEAVPAPSPPVSDMPANRPPNDGAERDWDKLKSILKELKCPPVAINRIAVLSGYGKTDNPVWNAVEEIRNKGDDILQPGKWIIDYIRDNTT